MMRHPGPGIWSRSFSRKIWIGRNYLFNWNKLQLFQLANITQNFKLSTSHLYFKMGILQIITIVVSISALILSLHTKYQQLKKRELRELANKLKQLYDSTSEFLIYTRNPEEHEDIDLTQEFAGKEMVSYHYENDEDPRIYIDDITLLKREDGEFLRPSVKNQQQAFEQMKEKKESIHFRVKLGSRELSFNSTLNYPQRIFEDLEEIREEHESLMEDFDDELLDSLEDKVDEIAMNMLGSIFQQQDGFEINVEEHETTYEIGEHAYRQIVYYDNIESDLEELENLNNQVEDLRTDILQASYF